MPVIPLLRIIILHHVSESPGSIKLSWAFVIIERKIIPGQPGAQEATPRPRAPLARYIINEFSFTFCSLIITKNLVCRFHFFYF